MRSECFKRARTARESLAIPPFSAESVHIRARNAQARLRAQLVAACCTAAIIFASVGTGAAARLYNGIRVWIAGGKAAILVDSMVTVSNPTVDEVRDVASRAAFPVVFPTGLLTGSRMLMLMYSPVTHPTTIYLEYRQATSGRTYATTLVQTSSIENDILLAPPGSISVHTFKTFHMGAETVIVAAPLALEARIQHSMAAQRESANLAAAISSTRSIIVLVGVPQEVADRAEAIGAPKGSVLLGNVSLAKIAALAAGRKPLLDTRQVTLTHIPHVNGNPDYMHARYAWSRRVALPSDAVRALAGMLERNQVRGRCGCAILVSTSTSGTLKAWLVDAKTLRERPLHA